VIGYIAAPAPPVVLAPGPHQASFGAISGKVGHRAVRVVVRVNGRLRGTRTPRGGRFSFHLRLPPRDVSIRVTAVDTRGHGASTTIRPVLGLPAAAAPQYVRSTRDGKLMRLIGRLVRRFPGTSAVYVEDLRTGRGAAFNARARFSAGSTLKLAIAIGALRLLHGPPRPGSSVAHLMDEMLLYSDNAAANQLADMCGGGYTLDEMLRALGLNDTELDGGYIVEPRGKRAPPIPTGVTSQPSLDPGKYTSAFDLARLIRYVELAAAGKGQLAKRFPSFTPAAARYLLYELAHIRDPGKLSRYLPKSVRVAHKAGWHSTVRHDNGLVFWRRGSFVATVMTWNPSGVGTNSDVLAGRVAWLALRRFARLTQRAETRKTGSDPASGRTSKKLRQPGGQTWIRARSDTNQARIRHTGVRPRFIACISAPLGTMSPCGE
jgi:beta-lactamase class A